MLMVPLLAPLSMRCRAPCRALSSFIDLIEAIVVGAHILDLMGEVDVFNLGDFRCGHGKLLAGRVGSSGVADRLGDNGDQQLRFNRFGYEVVHTRVEIASPLFGAGVAGQGRPALFGNLSSLREAL